MDNHEKQKLAIAFAQAKLASMSNTESRLATDDDELRDFLKMYRFAIDNIDHLWDTIG